MEETRIAVIAIVVEDRVQVNTMNEILHDYGNPISKKRNFFDFYRN